MARPTFFGGLLALLIAPGLASANPADLFGFGARGPAMGSAQAAAADDATANYYNPALLATFDEIRIDLGYQYARPSLEIDEQDLGVDSSRGLVATLSAPGRVGGYRVAIGGGVFLPDRHITRTRTLSSQKPRFALYDNRPQRLFLAANLAIAFGERLFIGAGISYMSSTQGAVLLEGRVGFPNADDSDLDLGIDVDLKTIRYPQFGAMFRATPWLDVALSYRGGFRLFLDQIFDIHGDIGPEGVDPIVEDGVLQLRSVSQDLFQPAQLTAGFAAQLTPRFALAFDLAWHRWSVYENPAARIDLVLDVGSFNDLIDIPPSPPLPDPHFHDIAVPRLGVEYVLADASGNGVALRGGYVYEPSPAPEQVGETNFIDDDKHTLSAGGGLTLSHLGEIIPRPMSLDVYAALTLLEGRSHAKLSPVDAIGDYRSGGRVWQGGVTSSWRF
jgi:long-chain fatty acid transport protein